MPTILYQTKYKCLPYAVVTPKLWIKQKAVIDFLKLMIKMNIVEKEQHFDFRV